MANGLSIHGCHLWWTGAGGVQVSDSDVWLWSDVTASLVWCVELNDLSQLSRWVIPVQPHLVSACPGNPRFAETTNNLCTQHKDTEHYESKSLGNRQSCNNLRDTGVVPRSGHFHFGHWNKRVCVVRPYDLRLGREEIERSGRGELIFIGRNVWPGCCYILLWAVNNTRVGRSKNSR